MKVLGSLAAMGLVVFCCVHVATADPVAMSPAGTESPTPPLTSPDQAGPTFHKAPARAALPDSVLARMYFAKGSSNITRRQFLEAAQQLQLPPETLTPELRGQVLDLLLQKRALSHRALAEPRRWAHVDSVNYQGLSDRLTLTAVLDSAMAELGFSYLSHGDSVPDREALGIMLRDSAVAKLSPVYDEGALALIAKAFADMPKGTAAMSLQEQMRLRMAMPSVSKADSARLLIRSELGTYTVGELLKDFGRLNPAYRPQVGSASDVRDVANSVIYEKLLRRNAVTQNVIAKPAIAAQLRERAEFLDVQSFVRRAAYEQVPTDSVTLRRHFDAHPRWFDAWARAEIVRGIFATAAEADSFADTLTPAGAAESLVTQRMPSGMKYGTFLLESADTALFNRVQRAGTKAVVGPDETTDGWRVIRALRFEPRKPRAFDEVRDIVLNDWYQRDGDRRVRELLQQIVDSTLVQTNTVALARIGPAPVRRSAPRATPRAK